MANTNLEALVPEFWASAFDEFDQGQLNLHNQVNRSVETILGSIGDTVDVPIAEDATEASEWDGSADVTPDNITQTVKKVILEKSFVKRFELTSKDLSRKPYDLIQQFAIPRVEGLLLSVNKYLQEKLLESQYFIDGTSTFTEDTLTDARTLLTNNKASLSNRLAIMSPTDTGALLKRDAFKLVNQSGTMEAQAKGNLGMKSGFQIFENTSIDTYTPADLTGAINNGAGYSLGDTTIVVDGFDDDATPIKAGDIFTIAGETGGTKHTVLSTTTTTSDTTGITFYPALTGAVADDAVVTVTPTRSVFCFTPNALGFAARTYNDLPSNSGINTSIQILQGLPIRISVGSKSSNVGVFVQMDVLVGATLIKGSRVARIIR
jgi:hypothetical protein